MWIITDTKGDIVGQVEPSRGHMNLGYQLISLGVMQEHKQLQGLGTFRQIVDEKGNTLYHVAKIPYIPKGLRSKGSGALFKPLDVGTETGDTEHVNK